MKIPSEIDFTDRPLNFAMKSQTFSALVGAWNCRKELFDGANYRGNE